MSAGQKPIFNGTNKPITSMGGGIGIAGHRYKALDNGSQLRTLVGI